MQQEQDQGSTAVRGVRGATTVAASAALDDCVAELVKAIEERNQLRPEELAAAIFTVTPDLAGTNPAKAARRAGWGEVPVLAVREHGGDAHLPRCVRVLVLWNTRKSHSEIRHVYLHEAASLRPDLDSLIN